MMGTAKHLWKRTQVIDLGTWQVDTGIDVEYGNYCEHQRVKRQTPLSFRGWLLHKRRTSDNIFDETRRRADILWWSDDCFLAAAEECMWRYGKYFGVRTTTNYTTKVAEIEKPETYGEGGGGEDGQVIPPVITKNNWYRKFIEGIELKHAPRPWDVKYLRLNRETSPASWPCSSTASISEHRKGRDAKNPPNPPSSAPVENNSTALAPSRALVPATRCGQCQEISTELPFQWHTTVIDEHGSDRPLNFCSSPRCCTLLNGTELDTARREDRRTIRCYRCKHSMCIVCGALRRPLRQRLNSAVDSITDVFGCYSGSEPYRRAARRAGFLDRSLREIYVPPNAADVHLTRTLLSPPEPRSQIIERAGRNIPYDITDPTSKISSCSGAVSSTANGRSECREPSPEVIFRCDDTSKVPGQVSRVERDLRVVGTYDTRLPEISFDEIHERHPSDQWFAARNRDLYDMVVWFAGEWFGDVDFPAAYQGSAWLEELGPQLINYANLVGHEDELGGDWETMLRSREHRKWLVVGVVAQIIEKKIYNELLFGAPESQAQVLDMADVGFLKRDGYERAGQRAATINLILERRLVPDNFWPAVDRLSAHVMEVFLPLVNLLCPFRSAPFWTDPFRFYASLREIIAHAGYYSVTMRRSPGIFYIVSATPGARMDYPVEAQACYDLYRATKEEADRRQAKWVAEETASMEKAKREGKPEAELNRLRKAHNIESYHRIRGAKIKYAVWPTIKRYKPENVGKPAVKDKGRSEGHDVEQGEGQRIVDIGQCVVIYYQGVLYPKPPAGAGAVQVVDGLPLLAHVAAQVDVERRRRKLRSKWLRFLIAGSATLGLYLSYETTWPYLRDGLPALADEAYERARRLELHQWGVLGVVALGTFKSLRHFVIGGAFICCFVCLVGYLVIGVFPWMGVLIASPPRKATDTYVAFYG